MPVKALIVDVDGVIVGGRPHDGCPWSSSLAADLGLSPAVLQREFFQAHWAEVVNGRASLAERLTPVLKQIAPQLTVERFVAYWFEQDSRVILPLTEELLSLRSKGIKVYLATNQEHQRARYLMQTLRLAACCDGMYYSAQLGVSKPDPEFFLRIAYRTGLHPHELLLADDTLANVQAASALGWQTIHWTPDTPPSILREALG